MRSGLESVNSRSYTCNTVSRSLMKSCKQRNMAMNTHDTQSMPFQTTVCSHGGGDSVRLLHRTDSMLLLGRMRRATNLWPAIFCWLI